MDDKQLALLLTAMSDQTAAMNRMADAMQGILLHLDPKQAAKFAAPGYLRPLAAYASFDWNSIDARLISWDRHGATEVEYNGVAFRRYRSNEDDPKGVDIRFRRVVSGTPEGKDMVWATLIKFAEKKAKDAPRPLRGELAERIEKAAADQAQRVGPPIAIAIAPTTMVPTLAEPEPTAEHMATQIKAEMAQAVVKSAGMRQMDDTGRARLFTALKATCGGEDPLRMVIGYLFSHTNFKSVSSAEAWALHGWLKPTTVDGKWVASNTRAIDEIKTILSAAAELQPA